MELVASFVGAGIVLALFMGALARWAARARRRGAGRAVLAVVDEVFHPTAHEAHLEVVAQEERQVPRPAPGDL